MLTKLKSESLYEHNEQTIQHDAHIKAYQAQKMGIKVVFCDSRGVPFTDSMAPMASYLPNTSYNM